MRIQFISNYSDLYGANRSLLSIIEHFHANKDNSVTVLLPSNGSMASKLKEIGIPFQIVPFYPAFLYIKPILKHLIVPALTIFNLIMFPKLILKVKKFDPDIIYSNTSAENIGVLIAKTLHKKHISHIREFMSSDHNSYFIFGKKAKRKFINLSDGSIYVSKSVLESVQLEASDILKYRVIYNGIVSTNKVLKSKQPNFKKIIFGIVGILDPGKGQHIAIEYFSRLKTHYPNSILLIYGDKESNYKRKLVKLVHDLNLNNSIKFCGFVNDSEKIYDSIDILLMFSKSEGFGRVTIEAALSGVPVIGYDNAGTNEIIKNNETGCLFSDYDSFLDSLSFIRENYDTIRKKSFENAIVEYDVSTYCKNVETFVNEILNSK